MSETGLLLAEIQALKRRIQALETVTEHPGFAASDVARLSQPNAFAVGQTVGAADVNDVLMTLDGLFGHVADLQQWMVDGSVVAAIDPSGNFDTDGNITAAGYGDFTGTPAKTIKSDSTGNLTASQIDLPNHFSGTYASAAGASVRQVYANPISSGVENTATLAGFYAQANFANTGGRLTHGFGVVGRMYKTGADATVQQMAGVYADFNVTAAGAIDAAYGFYQNPAGVSAGTLTAAYGMDLNEPSVTGTGVVQDNYGIRIGTTTVGTQSNYGLYIEPSAGYGIYNADGDVYSLGDMDLIGDMDLTGSLTVQDGNVSIISADVSGSELLTNGAFTSDTASWSAGGSATLASVAGGQAGNCLEVTNAGGGTGYAVQAITTIVGQRYRWTLYYKNGTATQGAIYVGTTSGGTNIFGASLATAASWTARTVDFTATATTSYLRMGVSGSTVGHTMLYDTVSAKSMLGGRLEVNAKITGWGGTEGMAISATTGEVTADYRVTAEGGMRTAAVTIADDVVVDLRSLYPGLAVGGLLLISTVNYANTAAIIHYRAAASPFCTVVAQPGAADVVVGTTALTDGTSDGTDAKLNLAALSTGELYVKNRRGATVALIVTVLN